jgi:hypothetical protein
MELYQHQRKFAQVFLVMSVWLLLCWFTGSHDVVISFYRLSLIQRSSFMCFCLQLYFLLVMTWRGWVLTTLGSLSINEDSDDNDHWKSACYILNVLCISVQLKQLSCLHQWWNFQCHSIIPGLFHHQCLRSLLLKVSIAIDQFNNNNNNKLVALVNDRIGI